MNLNYHIASGANNPWRLADSVFDEGVDINTILVLIEATIIVVMVGIALSLRGKARRGRVEAV